MAEEDKEQKTEQPSDKRLREAREKGNVLASREVTNFLMMLVLAISIGNFAPSIMANSKVLLTPFITDPDILPVDAQGFGKLLNKTAFSGLAILALPVLLILFTAIFSRYLQSGEFLFSTEALVPKLSRISPMAGFKKLFSLRNFVEFLKGFVKISIVSIIGYMAVAPELQYIMKLPDSTVLAILLFLSKLAMRLMIGICIALFFIAAIDYFYQRYQYLKDLRMTKQEVKDEYRQMEGSPEVKKRLWKLRQERARKRMMAAVPESDVVITNPTHYAIALKYDRTSMQAPVVVAKGQDLIAQKIREIAKEHDVPIMQNAPLARALFNSTEVDEEIPIAHYEAVAKIISYVYQLKGKKF